MKHLITTTLLLLALLLPTHALAHDFEVDGIYYNIINSNEVEVTYQGSSYYQYQNEYSGSVTIPTTVTYNGTTYSVTTIGNYAFYNCTSLTTINIPNSVTTIGGFAFEGTAWYNNQPDGVVYAGLVAYIYKGTMPEGTSITLKEGTKGIAAYAFADCSGLTNINIPNSVISISNVAFSRCSCLASISVASDNPNYDSRYNCNAIIETETNTLIAGCKNTIIPNSVTYIGEMALSGCTSLTTVDIPNSVTNIGDHAFSGCSSLTTVNIPNSVTTIGHSAFSGCESLTTVNIPNSVTTISFMAFDSCTSLTNINIPNSVTAISNYAFEGCSNLTNISIPNSVTNIGNGAFSDCSSLTTINIPNSVTNIGSLAFYGCPSLATVNIGNSVTTIGEGAFWHWEGDVALNNVYCYATIPPECINGYYDDYTTFSHYSATLHVPATSLAAYFTAPEWSNFANIVGDAVVPTGIAISRDSVEVQSDEQFELTATVTPANASCKEVTWYSTDTSIATVENGVVTAVGYGECDIFAYCMGMPAVCHITVANRISLEEQEAMLLPNHMLTLTPSAPAMPSGFTATSSDPTVAAVRMMNGKVQIVGIKEGTTTITVASADGTAQPATCLVTVYTEPCDVNCDGFITIGDATQMIDYLLGGTVDNFKVANADVNGDGQISIGDVTILIDQLLSSNN